MSIAYFGTNTGPGTQRVKIKHSNGNTTFLKQRIVRHSPDGFQWGYGGSGPADLALNMLYDYLLRTHRRKARSVANNLHQSFKWAFVARQGKELSVTGDAIEEWLGSEKIQQRLNRSGVRHG